MTQCPQSQLLLHPAALSRVILRRHSADVTYQESRLCLPAFQTDMSGICKMPTVPATANVPLPTPILCPLLSPTTRARTLQQVQTRWCFSWQTYQKQAEKGANGGYPLPLPFSLFHISEESAFRLQKWHWRSNETLQGTLLAELAEESGEAEWRMAQQWHDRIWILAGKGKI